jgi:hypothetical protein
MNEMDEMDEIYELDELDWLFVHELSRNGNLIAFVNTIAVSYYNIVDIYFKSSLLHMAAQNDKNINALKMLLPYTDVNVKNDHDHTPLKIAILNHSFCTIKILCAAGADKSNLFDSTITSGNDKIIKYFIATGSRLKNLPKTLYDMTTDEIRRFESGVLKCRRATIAMLHAKRKLKLANWDKYLLAQLANYIWATRDDPKWQE